jgi:phospholipid transport system substrate-binding protein
MKTLIFLLTFCFSVSALFAAEDPVQAIRKKDAELQALLKKKNATVAEKTKMQNLLNDSFDFKGLAKKSLPTKVWKEQTPENLEKFTLEFERMVRNSSAKRLEVYRADSTVYEPAKMKGTDEARVVAHTWYKGKEAVLEYKMTLVNGVWKAWDLVIDDLSTARNYREQFSQILQTKSFEELITIVKNKADQSE